MMFRQSLLLGAATVALAGTTLTGAGHAQNRGQSRDDLLDALTRHIQICAEITDTQQRLSCYDRLQTQVGGVTAPPPTPTPLQAAAQALPLTHAVLLVRPLLAGELPPNGLLHVGVLDTITLIAFVVALKLARRRLLK